MNINYSSMKQVHNTNKSYHHYWGKASKKDCSYHLLVYHSLDVAAVGILLADRLRLAQHMAKRLDYDFQELLNIIAFLCAIHDIGKFSDGFQNLRPDLYQILKNTSTNVPYQERHGSLGYRFLCENVQSILGLNKDLTLDTFSSWFSASTGHHGRPPKNEMGSYPLSRQFSQEASMDTMEFAKAVLKLFDVRDNFTILANKPESEYKQLSWNLA